MSNHKLLWAILTMIPFLGPILYLVMVKDYEQKEKITALVALIPIANLVCSILLILWATEAIK